MTEEQWRALETHLFPGDGDEHGAVLRCGMATSSRGNRLLVRDVVPAVDGRDYVPGDRGYRKLTAAFAAENIDVCAEERLAYLAVHNHGGNTHVGFSATDMASHERGYPALLGINDGLPVGALVFAQDAVAGDIWTADGRRHEITHLRVCGRPEMNLTPEPTAVAAADPTYDRQARIFGDRGQAILAASRVAVVGVGGAGSLVSEYLARLGVGEIILIDPDRLDETNLPRVVGARRRDLPAALLPTWVPRRVIDAATRRSTLKVRIAARVAREASPASQITAIPRSVLDADVATVLTDCDHIFLAADSALARRLVNSITHQYLVPHTQVGAKVSVSDGRVSDIFSISRMSAPGSGCLRCNGLIPASRLTEEATSEIQRRRQRYVDDADVHAPSVISLNAVAASRAVDDWLMNVGGLIAPGSSPNHWVSYSPMTDETFDFEPVTEPDCPHCGPSRFARGDAVPLLARPASA
ncbi:ThiF family adenylyltransferase [Rathayibacter sp. SD072]|uniref:HesA/MoeB/ThiF family protein n=1 Tax=Rathayibacter sp. SD072 TaxID=2781731 RepID=UPI001A95A0D4|nr:ThiF family adenylyltransferase [Rathayibacter sp. SD072]